MSYNDSYSYSIDCTNADVSTVNGGDMSIVNGDKYYNPVPCNHCGNKLKKSGLEGIMETHFAVSMIPLATRIRIMEGVLGNYGYTLNVLETREIKRVLLSILHKKASCNKKKMNWAEVKRIVKQYKKMIKPIKQATKKENRNNKRIKNEDRETSRDISKERERSRYRNHSERQRQRDRSRGSDRERERERRRDRDIQRDRRRRHFDERYGDRDRREREERETERERERERGRDRGRESRERTRDRHRRRHFDEYY